MSGVARVVTIRNNKYGMKSEINTKEVRRKN
jgi:hypothetical protein